MHMPEDSCELESEVEKKREKPPVSQLFSLSLFLELYS